MNDNDDPILCPECGGTGLHPWKASACKKCNGTGELTDDVYDERFAKHVYRAARGCFEPVL